MTQGYPPSADDGAALFRVPLESWSSPDDMLSCLGGGSAFLLESAGDPQSFSRWTMMGSHPVARFISRKGRNRFHWMSRGQVWTWDEAPLAALRRAMAAFPAPASSEAIPFAGGAVGVLSYELGRSLLPLHASARDDLDLPELSFFFFDRILLFDRVEERGWALAYARGSSEKEATCEAEVRARLLAEETIARMSDAEPVEDEPCGAGTMSLELSLDADAYRRAVGLCVENVHAGEAYELCLTTRFETEFRGDARRLYRELRRRNPAPFATFLRLPEATLVGSSPERFLKVSPDGRVEARPIKGTRPRGETPARDAALRAELAGSRKDRAENVMIVDLLRNDLSRVCATGSVEVPELCAIEDYASVFQMVSTITGRLAEGRDLFDLLASAFPGGSMTGAPKIAAMNILERLEPLVRGYYSGAAGYLGFDGSADLSMVIRSVQIIGKRAMVGAGGAVLASSDPDMEWLEATAKARAPLEALAAAQGLELKGEWTQ